MIGALCLRLFLPTEVGRTAQVRQEVAHIWHRAAGTSFLEVHKRYSSIGQYQLLVVVEVVVGSVRRSPGLNEWS